MAVIDTLTTRFEANIVKFEDARKRMERGTAETNKKIKESHATLTGELDKLWSTKSQGWNAALGNVFKNLKGGAVEEGTRSIGSLGVGLEALGVYGLGAAVALGAVAGAAEGALKAMEIGDELSDTSKKLQISSDALQEWRYASIAAGASAKTFDDAMASFNAKVGAADAGMGKAKKWFAMLGIDPKSLKEGADGLQTVMDRIAELPSAADRAGAAAAFGLGDMIPVINEGKDSITKLREEARKGLIPAETVAQLDEAKDKMEAAKLELQNGLTRAFAGLAPVIANATKALADWITRWDNWSDKQAASGHGQNYQNTFMGQVMVPGLPGAQANLAAASASDMAAAKQRKIDADAKAAKDAKDAADQAKVTKGFEKVGTGSGSKGPTLADVRLAEQIALAQASGDKARVNALNDQKAITDETKKLKDAGDKSALADATAYVQQLAAARDAAALIEKHFANIQQAHATASALLAAQAKYSNDLSLQNRANVSNIGFERDSSLADLDKKYNNGKGLTGEDADTYKKSKADIQATYLQSLANEEIAAKGRQINQQQDLADQQAALDVALISAKTAIATNAKDKADLELQAFKIQQANDKLDFDNQQNQAVLELQITQEVATQRIAQHDQTLALQDIAKTREEQAAIAQAQRDAEEASRAIQDRITAANSDRLTTLGQQQAADRAALARDQQRAREDLQRKIDLGTNKPEEMGGLIAAQNAETSRQGRDQFAATPFGKAIGQLPDTLTAIAMHTETAKQAWKDYATSFVADTLRMIFQLTIQKKIMDTLGLSQPGGGGSPTSKVASAGGWLSTIAKFIPHFASGTNSAPGGLAMINEGGNGEIVDLPNGSRVIPANLSRAIMGKGVQGGGGVRNTKNEYHFHNHISADGAVLTSQIAAWVTQGNAQTAMAAKAMTAQDFARAQRQKF